MFLTFRFARAASPIPRRLQFFRIRKCTATKRTTNARDDDGRTGIEWGVYGLPETYVVDRAGRIQYRHVGPLSRQTFEEMIMPLVIRLREQNE